MAIDKSLVRNAHFLGTKIRDLRKRNNLTMQDLSDRCTKVNVGLSPSVSYLSMIERGKRTPSPDVIEIIATVFQKESSWFLDDSSDVGVVPLEAKGGGVGGMAMQPGFLFSPENLQLALPDLLSQAAVSEREFAHLLIRAHQEYHQNQYPDLERAAEGVGRKKIGLTVADLLDLCANVGLTLRWVDFESTPADTGRGFETKVFTRSSFDPPHTININTAMQDHPVKLKYDLAVHIGHKVLHDSDGLRSTIYSGDTQLYERDREVGAGAASVSGAQKILQAWRDFESSFFAGALLCPRIAFRRTLNRYAHEISVARRLDLSRSVVMRRMTAVSNYRHWHYFDAYPPGRFKAVYRGNGIPLPWGNMRLVQNQCPQWGVFRKIHALGSAPEAQLSVIATESGPRLYVCESVAEKDLAGNSRALTVGIEIGPALAAQDADAGGIEQEIAHLCERNGGSADLPGPLKSQLGSVASILNIGWFERAIERPVQVICPREHGCARVNAPCPVGDL